MGSFDFTHFAPHTGSAQEAFDEAAAADRHNFGVGYDRGSIGQYGGFEVVDNLRRPQQEAGEFASQMMEQDNSRFSSGFRYLGCVPVYPDDVVTQKTSTLRLTATATGWQGELDESDVRDAVVAKLGDARINKIAVTSKTRNATTTITATDGKAVMKYMIVRTGTFIPVHRNVQKRTNDMLFATQSEARKMLTSLMKDGQYDDLEVIGIKVRESGHGLVQGSNDGTTWTVNVQVTANTAVASNASHIGWMFFGSAKE